jgi:poly-gamma-glutamate capsule biosynthesis protein CapA/YwtB (metallophosphatase superfamily)
VAWWKKGICLLLVIVALLAIFRPKLRQVQAPPQKKETNWSLMALGDVMLARNAGRAMARHGFEYPFGKIAALTRKATLTFANLESPIAESGRPLPGKQIAFRAAPEAAKALAYAGIDVVSLANNHAFDYGEEALLETIRLLGEQQIAAVGAGENWQEATAPLWLDVAGQKVAFIAASEMADLFFSYSYPVPSRATEEKAGVAPLEKEWLLEAIGRARPRADLIVVSLHWGVEDSSQVTGSQRALARELIDHGADLILGHHPHVLQGLEFYKDKLIVYSLANTIFDQNDETNKEGMLLTLQFTGSELKRVWALPTYIYEKGQGALAGEEKGERIRSRLIELSEALNTKCLQMGEAVYFFPSK